MDLQLRSYLNLRRRPVSAPFSPFSDRNTEDLDFRYVGLSVDGFHPVYILGRSLHMNDLSTADRLNEITANRTPAPTSISLPGRVVVLQASRGRSKQF
jgi:hypothetical protein